MQNIPINSKILSITDMASHREVLFLYDRINQTVWKTDRNGTILDALSAKGPGPEEFIKIARIKCFKDRFYVCDWAKRSIIEYNLNFKFIRTTQFKEMVRDVLVTDDNTFVMAWIHGKMIQKYDKDMKLLCSFGSALPDESIAGSQVGRMILYRNHIYFQHVFLARLEIYNLKGELVNSIPVPGFPEKPLISFETFTGTSNPNYYQFINMFVVHDSIYLVLRDIKEGHRWLYQFDPALKSFNARKPCPSSLVWDSNGPLYQIHTNGQDDPDYLAEFIF